MLVVGSKSLCHHFESLDRTPKDTDIIGYKSDLKNLIDKLMPRKVREGDGIYTLIDVENKDDFFNTNNVEFLIADNSKSLKMYMEYEKSGDDIKYASPEVLYSLKKSHIHFPIHFNKHIADYTFLNHHFKEIDNLKEITKINYKETEDRLGKLKTPSLNKKVRDFFAQSNDYVKSYFIHDDIHKAVAHLDKPLYLYMQRDIDIAKCDRDLWEEFPYENKCKCVLEEAYVIALERKILPIIFGGSKWTSSEDALDWSLMRICTNLCSGWFREFATNNYFEIRNYINKSYVEDFLEKYNNGEICRISESILN